MEVESGKAVYAVMGCGGAEGVWTASAGRKIRCSDVMSRINAGEVKDAVKCQERTLGICQASPSLEILRSKPILRICPLIG